MPDQTWRDLGSARKNLKRITWICVSKSFPVKQFKIIVSLNPTKNPLSTVQELKKTFK